VLRGPLAGVTVFMMRRRTMTVGRIALSAGLLALLFREGVADAGAVREAILGAHPAPLALAALLHLGVGWVARGGRWQALVRALGYRVSLARLIRLELIGTFFNHMLPTAIGGDVARTVLLTRDGPDYAHGASSVLADRVVTSFVGACVGLAVLAAAWSAIPASLRALLALAGVLGLALGGLVAAMGRLRRLLARHERLRSLFTSRSAERFADAFEGFESRDLLLAAAWSLVYTLTLIASHALLGRALGVAALDLTGWAVLVSVGGLVGLVPSISGWGVREWTYVGVVAMLAPAESADRVAAVSLTFGGLNLAMALVGGLFATTDGVVGLPRPARQASRSAGPAGERSVAFRGG
jgi:uncharacterized protein (TIRG00374 family)